MIQLLNLVEIQTYKKYQIYFHSYSADKLIFMLAANVIGIVWNLTMKLLLFLQKETQKPLFKIINKIFFTELESFISRLFAR